MDYTERLRRLAINDARFGTRAGRRLEPLSSIRRRWRSSASPRWSRSVARFRPTEQQADAAVSAGATAAEIVDVLVGVIPIVGLPVRRRRGAEAGDGARLRHRRGAGDARADVVELGYPPSRPIAVACCTASLRDETPSFR